ncbi:MAG: sugar phosphate isomerase/epimerase family protein [Opitutales bacterium]
MQTRTGLVSVTFRKLDPRAIVDLVNQAGDEVIEWGGDKHVPPGNTKTAEEVGRLTREAGLEVSCYGSYYRLGLAGVDPGNGGPRHPEFSAVLDSALALGAPRIRVWAGGAGSAKMDEKSRREAEEDALRIADQAQAQGVGIAYEYHMHTLTDEIDSSVRLLEATKHPAISTLWQPPNEKPESEILESLESVLPHISNVHVFHWVFPEGNYVRRPLCEGQARWETYLERLRPHPRDYLIEFVRGDATDQYLEDAACLKNWLKSDRAAR